MLSVDDAICSKRIKLTHPYQASKPASQQASKPASQQIALKPTLAHGLFPLGIESGDADAEMLAQ
jgi:hypothetical protein